MRRVARTARSALGAQKFEALQLYRESREALLSAVGESSEADATIVWRLPSSDGDGGDDDDLAWVTGTDRRVGGSRRADLRAALLLQLSSAKATKFGSVYFSRSLQCSCHHRSEHTSSRKVFRPFSSNLWTNVLKNQVLNWRWNHKNLRMELLQKALFNLPRAGGNQAPNTAERSRKSFRYSLSRFLSILGNVS